MQEHELLILGAGWTATFLIPLLEQHDRIFAATTTDGRDVAGSSTIKYRFDIAAEGAKDALAQLPHAKTVLVTFPLTTVEQSRFLVDTYDATHKGNAQYIQLGSTGIWQIPQDDLWTTRKSPFDTKNARAIAESELIKLGGTVLNLSGLWGGQRSVKHWLDRIASSKDQLRGKTSLHMIHGIDVSRAIVAVMDDYPRAKGQRWMLTDGFVYDWYSLVLGWADLPASESHPASVPGEGIEKTREPRKQAEWVYQLLSEEDIRALPRSMELLGRCYDSREFWLTFNLVPLRARLS